MVTTGRMLPHFYRIEPHHNVVTINYEKNKKLMMIYHYFFYVLFFVTLFAFTIQIDTEDNDFAEFEDFDETDVRNRVNKDFEKEKASKESSIAVNNGPQVIMSPEAVSAAAEKDPERSDEDDASVESEDDEEFEHLNNQDEFEGFDKERIPKSKSQGQPPDLKIVKVPLHFHTNWDSFYMEMLMLGGLGAYLLNYLAGKTKNQKLAQAWLAAHKHLLEENFSIIGDDGTGPEVQHGVMMKEAENVYSLWCSGRTCCEGMLVTIKLLKRQDLVSTLARFFRPVMDQIIIKVIMDEADMDSFVFCLANKRSMTKLQKDYLDLTNFGIEKKGGEKFQLPAHFQVLSECGEIASFILDQKITAVVKKFENLLEYIHFSDQYSGVRQSEDSQLTKLPEISKVLIFCFNVSEGGYSTPKDMELMKPLLQMVFYCVEKIKRFKLGKEAKLKAEKSRQKVLESVQKAAHSQRTEAAQNRKEEKRRAEKEKIMNEDDPDKQRKLEEKNLKKEAKRKQPKMKRMKIKAM